MWFCEFTVYPSVTMEAPKCYFCLLQRVMSAVRCLFVVHWPCCCWTSQFFLFCLRERTYMWWLTRVIYSLGEVTSIHCGDGLLLRSQPRQAQWHSCWDHTGCSREITGTLRFLGWTSKVEWAADEAWSWTQLRWSSILHWVMWPYYSRAWRCHCSQSSFQVQALRHLFWVLKDGTQDCGNLSEAL